MASSPELTIRFATEEGSFRPFFPNLCCHISSNVPIILALIRELAAYEKASASVLATESTLKSTLSFPSHPSSGYAKTLLIFPASTSDTPHPPCAGMALYFHNYSTWRAAPGIYLEDLFVRLEHRGKGYGTRLLGRLAEETVACGGERLEWSVLKWNEPSLRFYEALGAERMEEWVSMRVEGKEALGRLAGRSRR